MFFIQITPIHSHIDLHFPTIRWNCSIKFNVFSLTTTFELFRRAFHLVKNFFGSLRYETFFIRSQLSTILQFSACLMSKLRESKSIKASFSFVCDSFFNGTLTLRKNTYLSA